MIGLREGRCLSRALPASNDHSLTRRLEAIRFIMDNRELDRVPDDDYCLIRASKIRKQG